MMGNLIKWEMRQTFKSKYFWILGASLVALPSLLLFLTILFASGLTGYQAYLEGLNNYNAFLIFLIGVFAGIHITGAFEGRKIQSAVMAGNSRFHILLAKFLSYSVSVAIFSLAAIIVNSAIAFLTCGITGIEGDFVREIILRGAAFILVEVAYAATCFFSSMLVRHLGGAIGLNLGLLLVADLAAQFFLNFEWAEKYVRLTPVGQTMFILSDSSNSNIAAALAASVVALAAVVALSYVKFRREELK